MVRDALALYFNTNKDDIGLFFAVQGGVKIKVNNKFRFLKRSVYNSLINQYEKNNRRLG